MTNVYFHQDERIWEDDTRYACDGLDLVPGQQAKYASHLRLNGQYYDTRSG